MDRRPLELGLVPYGEAFDLQRSLAGAVSQGAIPETVVFLEHPPVVTLGRRTELDTELHIPESADVEIAETDRGGKSTFHGPGQLVCYPILYPPAPRQGREATCATWRRHSSGHSRPGRKACSTRPDRGVDASGGGQARGRSRRSVRRAG